MVDVHIRHLSSLLAGLALTWFVIHIPGEYAFASLWLMPTVAAFFAFSAWFAFAYRDMDQWVVLSRKQTGYWRQPIEHSCMDAVFDSIGRICIGTGILSALIQILSSPTHCSWELPFAMGIGVLIGAKALGKIPV